MSLSAVTVIVITFNEEYDLSKCLLSIDGWAKKIFIVDSYSQDKTLEIASQFNCVIRQHTWSSFAKQREWAINNLEIDTDWVFFVDADERLTQELCDEINQFIQSSPRYNGCYIRRKFYFLDKWLRHGGYYPCSEIRLFKKNKVEFLDEDGGARERYLIDGEVTTLKNDMDHVYGKPLDEWILKHNKLAKLEALNATKKGVDYKIEGLDRKVWIRSKIWKRLPRGVRPFILFLYRYLFQFGFLDGKIGFYYCLLHDFWYPLLVDINYYSLKLKEKQLEISQ